MKKLISTILSVCIVALCLLQCTLTPSARTSGNFEYRALDGGNIQITKYTGADTTLTVPSRIDGYTVTEIGWYAFENCSSLTDIILPETIINIGKNAFDGTAYYNNEANWENGILYLSDCLIATQSNNVNGKVVVKPGTRVIAESAFSMCENMTEIELPDTLLSIGKSAFYECISLTSLIIPDSVTHVGALEIVDYNSLDISTSKLTSVTIGDGITTIPANMFRSCSNLTEVTLGLDVKTIENEAFAYTAIENIKIPDSVEEIGYRAFFCCDFLSNVEIGMGINKIDSAAFDGENIASVTYAGNALQWERVTIEDHNEKIKENIEFLEEDTEATDTFIEANHNAPNSKTPVSVYIIIFLVIAVIVVIALLFFKKRGQGNDENK